MKRKLFEEITGIVKEHETGASLAEALLVFSAFEPDGLQRCVTEAKVRIHGIVKTFLRKTGNDGHIRLLAVAIIPRDTFRIASRG